MALSPRAERGGRTIEASARRRNGAQEGQEAEDPDLQPRPGDTIVSVDGEPFEDLHAFLRTRQAGDVVTLLLERRDGEQREAEVTLTDDPILIAALEWNLDPSEAQLALRHRWLTSTE